MSTGNIPHLLSQQILVGSSNNSDSNSDSNSNTNDSSKSSNSSNSSNSNNSNSSNGSNSSSSSRETLRLLVGRLRVRSIRDIVFGGTCRPTSNKCLQTSQGHLLFTTANNKKKNDNNNDSNTYIHMYI